MAKIRNKKTGQVMEVADTQLGQYGLSAPKPTQPMLGDNSPAVGLPPPVAPIQPTQPAEPAALPKSITGRSLEQHAAALNRAKQAGDTAAIKQITDDYNREYQFQKDMVMPEQKMAVEQKQKDEKAVSSVKSLASILDQLDAQQKAVGIANIPGSWIHSDASLQNFETNKNLAAQFLAKAVENGRLSDKDRDFYLNQIMNITPYGPNDYNSSQIQNLKNTVLKLSGVDPKELGGTDNATAEKPKQPDVGIDIKSAIKGGIPITQLPERAGQLLDLKKKIEENPWLFLANGQEDIRAMAEAALKTKLFGINSINPADAKNNIATVVAPFKAAADMAQDPAGYTFDHPVNALGTVAGIAGMGKTSELPIDEAVGSKVTKPVNVGMAIDEATGMPKKSGPIEKMAEAVNGGGSKEYIARQATNPDVAMQNEVLLRHGILGNKTESGRITATANAMKDVGGQLGEIYSKSDRVFKGDNSLSNILDKGLKEKGYSPQDIRFIKTYASQAGVFDIGSGDIMTPVENAWKMARKLEEAPPKPPVGKSTMDSAMAYKKLSQDTARVIREALKEKLPETRPLNGDYGALRDYYDNRLNDPKGLQLSGNRGIIGAASGALKDVVINPALDTTYKLTRDMRYRQGNWQPKGE